MGAAAAAGGASMASLGLSAFSAMKKGEGEQAAYDFQAARAERAAQFGKIQADLTDTQFREELNTTLANINVIRSAGRIDPTSPTSAALLEKEREISERQRLAAVGSIKAQIAEDEASGKYLRIAGDNALTMGYLNAGIKTAGGLSKMFSGGKGGG